MDFEPLGAYLRGKSLWSCDDITRHTPQHTSPIQDYMAEGLAKYLERDVILQEGI
jgi:hypothetical protein